MSQSHQFPLLCSCFFPNSCPSAGETSAQSVRALGCMGRAGLGEWRPRKSQSLPPPPASLNWRPISVFPGFITFLFCIFYGIYNPHHNIVSYSSLTCLCMCLFSSPLFYNMIIITIKQLAEALTYTNATVQSGRVEMCLETEVLILKSLLQHLLRT